MSDSAASPVLPGGVALSRVRPYPWPGPDGLLSGSPHLHTVCAESYLVLSGSGHVETLGADGVVRSPLAVGSTVSFAPGTVHRLLPGDPGQAPAVSGAAPAGPPRAEPDDAHPVVVTGAGPGLQVLVIMQNSGLPEAGDAVLTFPPRVLADPDRYAAAAAVPPPGEPGAEAAARARRDLAVEGYLTLRDAVEREGPDALRPLHGAAARLVRPKVAEWRQRWLAGAAAQAADTGDRLDRLAAGTGPAASGALVRTATPEPERFGMCGLLRPLSAAGGSEQH